MLISIGDLQALAPNCVFSEGSVLLHFKGIDIVFLFRLLTKEIITLLIHTPVVLSVAAS